MRKCQATIASAIAEVYQEVYELADSMRASAEKIPEQLSGGHTQAADGLELAHDHINDFDILPSYATRKFRGGSDGASSIDRSGVIMSSIVCSLAWSASQRTKTRNNCAPTGKLLLTPSRSLLSGHVRPSRRLS
jgi:hypothetical protein